MAIENSTKIPLKEIDFDWSQRDSWCTQLQYWRALSIAQRIASENGKLPTEQEVFSLMLQEDIRENHDDCGWHSSRSHTD